MTTMKHLVSLLTAFFLFLIVLGTMSSCRGPWPTEAEDEELVRREQAYVPCDSTEAGKDCAAAKWDSTKGIKK